MTGVGSIGNLYYASVAFSKAFSQSFSEKPMIIATNVYNPTGNGIVNVDFTRDAKEITSLYILLATNVTGDFGIDYVAIGK